MNSEMERRLERFSGPVLILAGVAILLYILELFRFIPDSLRVPMLWINFLIDFVFLCDLTSQLVILRVKYIKSPWFLIDLVSTLPIISSAMELLGSLGPQLQSTRAARGARVARVARIARTARLAKVARVARVATAARAARGSFLKTESDEEEETPLFNRALLISIPVLLAIFMIIAYSITQQEVNQLTQHINQQLKTATSIEKVTQIPEYLDVRQMRDTQIQKVFLTANIDGRLREFAFSVSEAHVRADRVQGLMLVFVLLTAGGVVYLSTSLASDQEEEEEESILRHFLSPAIVDKLDTNPEVVERFYNQWLSVFFIAIKGFKEAAETEADDIEAVALRRRRVMDIVCHQTAVVHQGVLDKFMGDTVMGWIGGPFSTHWNRLAEFRERLALDELEFVDQDIRSIARQLAAVEHGGESMLASVPSEVGIPSDVEAQQAYLKEALQEAEATRATLLEKHQAAKAENPSLEARHDEAMQMYQQQTATSAVLCCLDIYEEVAQQSGDDAFHELSIGIGSGPVSVGNFGSTDQIGFTVLGPTVDHAARLEPASAQYGCRLLIDLENYNLVKEVPDFHFRMLPLITIAGEPKPVAAYEAFKQGSVSPEFLDAFHEGVFAIQRQELQSAIRHFERAQQSRDGGDPASEWWVAECQAAIREGRDLKG